MLSKELLLFSKWNKVSWQTVFKASGSWCTLELAVRSLPKEMISWLVSPAFLLKEKGLWKLARETVQHLEKGDIFIAVRNNALGWACYMYLTCWNWTNMITELSLSCFQKVNQCSGIFVLWCIVVSVVLSPKVFNYSENKTSAYKLCVHLVIGLVQLIEANKIFLGGVPEAMCLFVWVSVRL